MATKAYKSISSKYFFGLILGAKLIGHIHHFKTTGEGSYAAHKALDEFYKDVCDIADSIIETTQGALLELLSFDNEALLFGKDLEVKAYLKALKSMIEDNRYILIDEKYSNIHNEIDNFITLVDKTLYKLVFLQ